MHCENVPWLSGKWKELNDCLAWSQEFQPGWVAYVMLWCRTFHSHCSAALLPDVLIWEQHDIYLEQLVVELSGRRVRLGFNSWKEAKIPSKDVKYQTLHEKKTKDTPHVFLVLFCYWVAKSKFQEDKRHIALSGLMYVLCEGLSGYYVHLYYMKHGALATNLCNVLGECEVQCSSVSLLKCGLQRRKRNKQRTIS